MAEKKDKRIDVKSASFKEIVDGEIVSGSADENARGPQPANPKKIQEIRKPARIEAPPEKSFPKISKPSGTANANVVSTDVNERKNGFREIMNGEYVDAPEAGKPGREGRDSGKHVRAEFTDGDSKEVQSSLKNSVGEGVLNSACSSIQNSYTTPLALALGASSAQIGILNSLENLASTVSYFPGAMLTKYFSRKSIWMVSQLISRILIWIPIILLPFLPVDGRVLILIILLAVSNFFLYVRSPAWSSMMGDLVPENVRGKYFGRRNMLIGISGVAATLAAGFLLAWWGFPAIFALSVIFALAAVFFFARMYEPPMKRIFHYSYGLSFDPKGWYKSIKLNKEFVVFTSYLAVMNFSMEVAAPFYAVYMLKDMAIGYEWFAVSVVVGALARALTQQYWGKLNDRFGNRKILIVCGFLGCFVPFGWMLVSNVAEIMIIKIYDGIIFAGFDLVVFNYLLEVAPAKSRPKYIAANNFFTGFGMVAGDLTGAVLVILLGASSFLMLAGLQLVFLASFLLRLACLSFLFVIRNIEVKQDHVIPVRYLFWQAIAVEPARGIKHAITFTFRYPSHVERDLRSNVKSLGYRIKLKMNK
jgi:MFS family permease